MYGSRSYGPIHQVDWCEETPPEGRGRAYRALIELLDVAESNEPSTDRVRVLTSGGAARDWQTGSGGILAPVAPSRYDIVLTSFRGDWREALAMLMGLPDGYVRLRLLSAPSPDIFDDEDEQDQVTFEWGGYLDQESSFMTVGDRGYEIGVRLSFFEGWGIVTGEETLMGASGRFAQRLRSTIDAFLARVAGSSALRTWTDWVSSIAWRPWVPTAGIIFGSEDPLFDLIHDSRLGPELFEDEDVDSVTFTRLLASRFNARIYQSEGKIYIDQPSMLGRGFDRSLNDQGPGRITQWEAAIGSRGADPGVGMIVDRIVDTREWTVLSSPQRAQGSPTNVIESATDAVPDVDNIALNGSFELEDGNTFVAHWERFSPPNPGTFVDWQTLLNIGIPGSGFGQRRAGILYDATYGTVDASNITNDDSTIFFEENPDGIIEFQYDHFQRKTQDGTPIILSPRDMHGRGHVQGVNEDGFVQFIMGMGQLTCAQDSQWADGMTVYVSGLIPGNPITNAADPEDNVVAIPEGTILYFYENDNDLLGRNGSDYICTFELLEDAKWGDASILGNPTYITQENNQHDGLMQQGFTCLFACWNPQGAFSGSGFNIGAPSDRINVQGLRSLFQFKQYARAPMVAVDGTPVRGFIRSTLSMAIPQDPGDPNADIFAIYVDDVDLFISRDGESSIDETACTTRNLQAPGGNRLDIPVADDSGNIVGDGPIAIDHTNTEGPTPDESLSALRTLSGGDTFATARGPDTSWTAGQFEAGDPPEGGGEKNLIVAPGIDCLASEDAVRLHTDPTGVGAQQQVQTSWLLKEGQDLRPHQVPLVWLPAYVVSPYDADDTEIRLTFPPSDLTGKMGNLLFGDGLIFEDQWIGFAREGITTTQGITVGEWNTDAATRIVGDGSGSGAVKIASHILLSDGDPKEGIMHLRNDGVTDVDFKLQGGASPPALVTLEPGDIGVFKLSGTSGTRLQISVPTAADIVNVVAYAPIFRETNPPRLDTMEIVVNGEPQTRATLGPITREIDGYAVNMETGFTVSLSPGDCVRVGVLCWWTRFRKDDLRGVIDFQGQAVVPNDDIAVSHDKMVR